MMQRAFERAGQLDADRSVEFFFDFASPFSYLAACRLPGIAKKHDYNLIYRPIDVILAKKTAGNYGPSNREVPAKLTALKKDLERWANRIGVPLQFPPKYQCEVWNIGCLLARDRGKAVEYVHEAYLRIWGEGRDPTDTEQLSQVSQAMGWGENELGSFVKSPGAHERYQAEARKSFEKGVFGAPIVRIGSELWWGNDRLNFVEEWMSQH